MKGMTWGATLAALSLSTDALALGAIADVQIVDRDSGATLSAHYFRGEYWVAGRPGAKYSIRVRNRVEGRILAVTSVDGVNVLSGASAGYDQEGYIFSPGQDYEITGWRKSQSEVAAFTFTDASNSYAERTGRPANVGVIGVAVFLERFVPPPVMLRPHSLYPPEAAAAAPRGGAAADSQARAERSDDVSGQLAAAPPAAAKLGTGHGERESSYVEFADFQRQQSRPNDVVRIRYDSLENLVALGVIRRPAARLPPPDAFPDGARFVPDPPG
jgi:hypothetical protein